MSMDNLIYKGMIILLKHTVWPSKASILVYALILSENGIHVHTMYQWFFLI